MMAFIYVIEYIGRFTVYWYTPGVVTVHTPLGLVIDKFMGPLVLVMLVWEHKEKQA